MASRAAVAYVAQSTLNAVRSTTWSIATARHAAGGISVRVFTSARPPSSTGSRSPTICHATMPRASRHPALINNCKHNMLVRGPSGARQGFQFQSITWSAATDAISVRNGLVFKRTSSSRRSSRSGEAASLPLLDAAKIQRIELVNALELRSNFGMIAPRCA
jgi:hypothetical protein